MIYRSALSVTVVLTGLILGSRAFASASAPLVLVHGANFSGASWVWVQRDLENQGIPSIAPSLYESGQQIDLQSAAESLCTVLTKEDSGAVLVGHSQGGAIVTQASEICPERVQALIYVAAVIPLPGEGVFDDLSQADNDYYAQCGTLGQGSNIYFLQGFEPCRKVFFPDAQQNLAKEYFTTMVGEPAGIGNSHADYVSSTIQNFKKYYIETTQDLIISDSTQHKIENKVPLQGIFTIDSSHTPFFEKHRVLSDLLAALRSKAITQSKE
jgi:pimeloyl-ACP methyl ester carboxylesterase